MNDRLTRLARWAAACAVPVLIVGPELVESHVASAAAPAASAPLPAPILAILSPIAAPECQAAGSATLLVPIVSGVLTDDLGLPKNVSVGDVLLEALGPVYVVCGDLPSTPDTQCSLDDTIEAVWPASISAELPLPNLVGALFNEVTAVLKTLGLPPQDALANALQCHIVTSEAAPTAPAAPPAGLPSPIALPSTGAVAPIGSSGFSAPPLTSTLSPTTTTTAPKASPAEANPAGPQGLLTYLEPKVPAIVAAIQVLLASLLFVFLVGSWVGSLRSRRRADA